MKLNRRLRAGAATLATALAAATAAGAEGSARVLMSAGAQAEWAAVGRLNTAGQGHCTATLIAAPDLAVTAAHCVHAPATGAPYLPHRLHFLAGWRTGRFAAHLPGAAVALAEGFVYTPRRGDPRHDIALIRLDGPAPQGLTPLSPARHPAIAGERVTVLSYGRDRPEALSAETGCSIIARHGPVLLTDCEAVPGVSGAPLLRAGPDGPEVLGVVSTSAGMDASGRGRAIAVALDAHLPALLAGLDTPG